MVHRPFLFSFIGITLMFFITMRLVI